MAFRPLGDRVLIKRVEEETKTKGGIIIPDTAKEKPQEGEVVAVGPGARDDQGKVNALEVKPGDRILFGKWSGTEVRLEGEDLIIMKESDILGIVGSGTLNDKGELRPLDVKAGDRILFGKWSGTEVKLDNEELLIMKESDIMGVLEGAAAQKKAA